MRSHSGSTIPAPQSALGRTPEASVPVPVGVHPNTAGARRDRSSLAPQAVLRKKSDTARHRPLARLGFRARREQRGLRVASVNTKHPDPELGCGHSVGPENNFNLFVGEEDLQRELSVGEGRNGAWHLARGFCWRKVEGRG